MQYRKTAPTKDIKSAKVEFWCLIFIIFCQNVSDRTGPGRLMALLPINKLLVMAFK